MYEQKDTYIVDFSEVEYYAQMHSAIKDGLCFPDYYGNNWDAFWDCLTDMYGERINIEFIGVDKLRTAFGEEAENDIEILKRILYRFKHNYNDEFSDLIRIKIQDEDSTYYID